MAQQVVIAGGGVIGAATAYYLSARGVKPTVVEACTPACSASGKAGGFLAQDWCDSSALGPLARASFRLHAELAETLQEDTGYRTMATHSVAVHTGSGGKAPRRGTWDALPSWIDGASVSQSSVIGSHSNTAQVHPERFTKALLAAVEGSGGSVLTHTSVIGLELDAAGAVSAVKIRNSSTGEEASLPVDAVVFAMGAWTSSLLSILPKSAPPPPNVSGLKVHSIVLADAAGVTTADALFLAYRGPDGKSLEPEIYPRPDSTVYVCGVSSEEQPPHTADEVVVEAAAVRTLQGVAGSVCKQLGEAEVLKQQACYLPCSDDGLPLIGAVPGVPGAYLATGHSCWGILNAPATGLGLSEMMLDGKASSVNLDAFDPARLRQ